MASSLSTLLVNSRLAGALEDRAYREGLLRADDALEADFVRLRAKPPASEAEDASLDLLMLYGRMIGGGGSMQPDALNRRVGENILEPRAPMVRRVILAHEEVTNAYNEPLFSPHELGDVRALDVERLVAASSHEAMTLVARDIQVHLATFKAQFEAEVVKGAWRDPYVGEPMPHAPCARAIAYHVGDLLRLCDFYYEDGDDAHEITDDDVRTSDIEPLVKRQIIRLMRDDRFMSYFEQLQATYFDLYDGSFVARLLGHEVAYDTSPVRPMISSREAEMHQATAMIRINLADVIDYFPLPRTVEEAIDFRGHARVIAFREALEQWLGSFGVGRELEWKLRRELALANRDLQGLIKVRKLKARPLIFGVKAIAGLIPIYGAATALIDAIDYFYERAVVKRTAWVVPQRACRLD